MIVTEIQIILILLLGLILFLLFIKRDEILSFFMPEKYAIITMLEADNNVSTWLQKKNDDLTFKFNEGSYNMFDLSIVQNPAFKEQDNIKPPELYKKRTAIYRKGRLSQFFYNEGNADPIDFRNIQSTSNPQLARQLEKTEVMRLFVGEDNSLMAMIQKALPWIIILGIIIIIVILTRNNTPQAVDPTLINPVR